MKKPLHDTASVNQPSGISPADSGERFEAMLKQVLSEEEARAHRTAKDERSGDRGHAVDAKLSFELNRSRPRKQRKREPKRNG
ncbi:hypothetical protein [Microvirga sp. 2TAF3]|uniref:hypothetical protein n=1 Tax=Microvirga sp. 2TAF3 TaxID=3233014 RepID=UPI003F98E77B